ncbi:MAG: helix-turn-helix transcriptional regulator [Agathobacter sp.]|nr:helix-turn-helix transcriptional regulator [Agathobacter sp.]
MEINIGERIAYFRTSRNFSVNYLANQAGVSQSYLREIELGNYKNPSIDILDALCNALGISLKEFFDMNSELKNADDSLLKEISLLNPNQRENLRIFLNSIHD